MADHEHRLPRTVVPSRYRLELEPDLDAAAFAGTAEISVTVVEPTDIVVLNAVELEIDHATIEAGGSAVEPTLELDASRERLTLGVDEPLAPGPATNRLSYRGTLNDRLRGFYRSVWTDAAGVEHVIATTQMEPTDARRAFPCWDEPDLKAAFEITLVVADGLTAVSNGPVVDETDLGDGRRRVRFAPTMVMSTYLVAVVVGELDATEPVDVEGVPLRVVTPPGKVGLADFALDVGAFCLRFFSEYYGIGYPDRKVDLVAIPDFAAGAMENLGCITFRETALLVDPETATQAELERVADVVAHELAHMWFGDLVTMRWWNGIWLNEAFATFMELAAVDAFRPNWERWVTFAAARDAAFDVDALASTRPVEFPVHAPAEAEGMFDILTYTKGASVLRMLEQYLGTDTFRAGIRAYLAAHSHANTETSDLWDALEQASGEPARRIMDSWIYVGGVPIIDAATDGVTLTLAQRPLRFDDEQPDLTWEVPVLVRDLDDHQHRVLVTDSATLEVEGPAVVNAGGHGYFRVAYDAALTSALTDHLGDLTAIERHALVADTWAAVVAGTSTAADYLDLVFRFGAEEHRAVWGAIVGGLDHLDRLVGGPARDGLRGRVRALVQPAVDRLGWEAEDGEPDTSRQLRGRLITTLGVLGVDDATIARCREMFDASTDGGADDPDVIAAAESVVAHTGDEADYERLLHLYRSASTPQAEQRRLFALADLPSVPLAERTVAMCVDGTVRTQNAPYLIGRVLANREAGTHVWPLVEQHWDDMVARFPFNSMGRMLEGIRLLDHPDVAARVDAFLAEHPLQQASQTIAQHRERLRVNVMLRAREQPRLTKMLS